MKTCSQINCKFGDASPVVLIDDEVKLKSKRDDAVEETDVEGTVFVSEKGAVIPIVAPCSPLARGAAESKFAALRS